MSLKISMTPTRSENLVTFGLDRDLIPPGTGLSFASAAQAEGHPLARALFRVRGVKSVWILGRDIQVGKDPKARWASITAQVIEAIRACEAGL